MFPHQLEFLDQIKFVIGKFMVSAAEPADGKHVILTILNEVYSQVQDGDISAASHRDLWPDYIAGEEQHHEIEAEVTPPQQTGGAA